MLTLPEKLLFLALAVASFGFAWTGFRRVASAVLRGERGRFDRTSQPVRRAVDAGLRTLSQSTVFRARPWVSLFHAFVFYGFVYYLLVNAFDVIKGFVPAAWMAGLDFGAVGGLYRLGADVLSVLILVGIVFFVVRRFVARDARLEQAEATPVHEKVAAGSIRRDSLIVAVFIFLHVGFRLVGEGFLLAAEGHGDVWQPFASGIAALVGFGEGRIVGWHVGWWGALGLILAFLPYFPRSKHLHLIAAPVDFALEPRGADGARLSTGALEPIDFEDETLEQYGAAKLEHLGYPQLLDPYACIQCNRCSNVCPANQTGKALSPAALEINKRYELNLIVDGFAAGEPSPRDLTEFAISDEAVWACTTCGACIDVCPVGCEQMIDIVDIRRDKVMMQGDFPSELQTAFRGMERTGNPWGIGADKRMEWADGLNVPTVEDHPEFDVLFWVGCAGSYDPAAQATTRAMVTLLEHAGVDYAVIGKGERCTGDPARRAGNEYLYYQLAAENVLTLDDALATEIAGERSTRAKKVVTTCPHCYNALFNDYPQLGGDYDVVHHTEFLDLLVAEGRLPPLVSDGHAITYHDPCYLGRHNGVYEAPRSVLRALGELREMPRNRSDAFCCGAGGAQFWKEEEPGTMRVSENRYQEAKATGAEVVAAGCPFCKVMLSSSESAESEGAPEVVDVAQLLADRVERIQATLDASTRGQDAPPPAGD